VSNSSKGVDISALLSSSSASCLKSSGYETIIPRGFRSTGVVDTNGCTSLKNAQAAGITHRDIYIFPCPTCSKTAA